MFWVFAGPRRLAGVFQHLVRGHLEGIEYRANNHGQTLHQQIRARPESRRGAPAQPAWTVANSSRPDDQRDSMMAGYRYMILKSDPT